MNYFSVVGSCNGLICLSDDQRGYMDDIYLWNPSIRKSFALPTYNVTFESHGPFMHCLGFGFDSVTDDFKVVRVVHIYAGEGYYGVPPEVEIYTLKTGNWRYISDKALPAMISKRYRQAYVNGAAHWMAYSRAAQAAEFRPTILSFDMSDEVFNQILVPDSMDHGEFVRKSMILVVFKESLSLIELCDCDPHCTIWIMKEYGVATSWAKLFRIDLCEGLRNPLGLRKNSEVIFETCDGNLVSCNSQCQIMGIHGTLGNVCSLWHTFCIDTYAESLVLLN